MASSKNNKSKSKSSTAASRAKASAKKPQPPPPAPLISPTITLILGIAAAVAVVAVIAVVLINNGRSASGTSGNAAGSGGGTSLCLNATTPSSTPPANAPKQFSAPQQVIDPTHVYCAFLTTAHGVIVAELYPKSAPQHVNSFVFLAQQGFFDGITWHRVIPNFVAQTGDPTGTGSGGPGYSIPLEIDPNLKYDKAGVLGMARSNDPNSAGSQFFITYGPTASLNGGYTIFGQVVSGMDVAQQITPRDPSQNPNAPPGDKLISVRVLDATAGK